MTRGKGEGSVYKRPDGLWAGAVELPTQNGKRKRRVVTGKTKALCLDRMREVQAEVAKHGDIPTVSLTLADYMDYWLTEVAERTRRPKTVEAYRSISRGYIVPALGKIRVAKLTAVHVRQLHKYVLTKGKSSTTARNVNAVLSAALKDAVREGRMSVNPCALVEAPRKQATHLDTLSTEEARAWFKSGSGNPDMYLWAVYLLTGTRRGEVIGMEWDRIEGGVLDLSWQLQRLKIGAPYPADYEVRPVRGGIHLTRPKTASGWRIIPLVEPLASYLREWRTMAPANPWGLVFTRLDRFGNAIPLDPDYISRAWAEYAARTWPNKHVRLHDLRHTAVDLMLEAGVPEDVIVEICGWSARAMVQHYKSKTKLARRAAALGAVSSLLQIDS